MPPEPDPKSREAARLKQAWTQRARSEARDFFVASHPGWQDPARWAAQAETDASVLLSGLDPAWLADVEVLEIGCGVGRLVPPLLARVRGYTGIDVAAPMVAEARQRLAGEARARFLESDGRGIPAAAADRRYGLALAQAVFIHCPRELVEALSAEALALLRPEGLLRFQLLADPTDPEGLEQPEQAAAVHEEIRDMEAQAVAVPEGLIDEGYMGHPFRWAEARELFSALGDRLELRRFDLGHIYGSLGPRAAR
ncbi:MAG: class I SAM-dependent methyltransferase [Planctomycetota bacterium]